MKWTVWIVVMWWVITSLVAGTAWAQDVPVPAVSVPAVSTPQEWVSGSCPYTWEQWNRLSAAEQVRVCGYVMNNTQTRPTTTAVMLPLPPKFETRAAHPTMGLIGVVMSITGVIMVAPRGEEYHIFGDTVCVSFDYHTIENGGCQRGLRTRQVGLALMGAGIPMTYFGLWKEKTVLVSPQVSPTSQGVTATIRWGGSHAR